MLRCILSKFYIKPQLARQWLMVPCVVSYRNSTSNHNSVNGPLGQQGVVSYRNSTSNHNCKYVRRGPVSLYLIEILHQTTTHFVRIKPGGKLYLIEILHQTTTYPSIVRRTPGCILSKFYIKPQPGCGSTCSSAVVSYRNSTSNHNGTSLVEDTDDVVSYRNSTSNHNFPGCRPPAPSLYLIEILHQTTTSMVPPIAAASCILSKFYIKPQPWRRSALSTPSCILSKFYIKPQLLEDTFHDGRCCILSKFYIKPQRRASY